jgi:DNA-binding transcriptional ArsR family regulator
MELITETNKGVEIVERLADCLKAIGNPTRFRIVEYCVKPHRFTDITINLRLNPASFKFHSRVLAECDLIEKVERGIYHTTDLGKLLLTLVNTASEISD